MFAAHTKRHLNLDVTYDVLRAHCSIPFARWRLACIGEGVLARYNADVMGDDGADTAGLAESVVHNAEAARAELRG